MRGVLAGVVVAVGDFGALGLSVAAIAAVLLVGVVAGGRRAGALG